MDRDDWSRFRLLAAGAMWGLSPENITNAAVVRADLPAASFTLLSGLIFWRWAISGRTNVPILFSVAIGLAMLCKFTSLVLFLALPIALLIRDGIQPKKQSAAGRASRLPFWLHRQLNLSVAMLLSLVVVNAGYGFSGSFTAIGDYEFKSQMLAGERALGVPTDNRFRNTALHSIPVPIPREMLQGMDYVAWEFDDGKPSYMHGQWFDRGRWYFYLYAMLVKIPSGYWLLAGISLATFLVSKTFKPQAIIGSFEWFPLWVAVVYLAFVSSQTGFTHHLRYVLPAMGLLMVSASRFACVLSPGLTYTILFVCLLPSTVLQLARPGMSHTYFNVWAGGANDGWQHLNDSNVDWGQSTYRMIDWVNRHPEKRPMNMILAAPVDSPAERLEGVSNKLEWTLEGSVEKPKPGWYLVSANQLTTESLSTLRNYPIVSQPYPDVLLFHVVKEGKNAEPQD